MVTTQIMSSINNNSDVHIQNKPRHISLIEHANNFQLLPPEIVKYVLDIEKDTNIQFIKQRSPEWFQIHKQARITGSTLNSGIGLDTLQKQKLLNIGLIRMNILMLNTRNVEQTKDVRMYIEEFILVDIWIHCCTKLK